MVDIPIVIAYLGTLSIPKKSAAASILVSLSKFTSLVSDVKAEPGSLKPTCPVLPIPNSCRSIPPYLIIFYSY